MSDVDGQDQDASEPIHVPGIVDETQVSFYLEKGFLVLPGLIGPDELNELKDDAVRIARGEYPCPQIEPLAPQTSAEQVLRSILCIHQPHHLSPVMMKYVQHPKICGVLSQIIGAHIPHWDGSVKCMQSMLFVKPPEFQGQAWHQDEIYIPTRDRSLCGAWIAMDDATIANGCLWVLPESHRSGYLYPAREHDDPDEFDEGSQSWGFDDSGEMPVEVRAGGVVFFNGYLLHRSQKNRASTYRRVLVNHYMNAWSLLPWRHEEGVGMAQQDERCVVPVAGTDPYAWKGYRSPKNEVGLRTSKATREAGGAGADVESTKGSNS